MVEKNPQPLGVILHLEEEVEKGTDTDKTKTDTTEPVQDQNQTDVPRMAVIQKVEKKKEKKNPPLLFNLAEIQNENN